MRTIEFDSSSDDEDIGEEQLTPIHISWLPLSVVDCSQFLGICALPGCKYKEIRRNLQSDVEELHSQGVQDVFVFCTRAELNHYRVPALLDVYQQRGFTVHHMPFPDGSAPELPQCCQILEELQFSLENNRRTLVHCFGGLGRSALILLFSRCLSAAQAFPIHDPKQSHRHPQGVQRRSHSDCEAIQLPAGVPGEVHGVPAEQRRLHRALSVSVTADVYFNCCFSSVSV
ncbi:cyclin-dependent kinase inhibitor 3 isoform X1 [Cynoglossus semilaevis]|uniref:cyclin-dependent kinase inhibitor 3 isoform X1 n=1 Tax=Cynoglossus semilaevis TaxID=244447 RepID=UPI0004967C62|nr:cyclin-dependent kinase inhibitor 3 isoform X1 [Cynoglossus semilaevis]XP_024911991.1 cyclin-dependent kinase inhibitor 3 isoform X1 [Cynoglossus semilaevis]